MKSHSLLLLALALGVTGCAEKEAPAPAPAAEPAPQAAAPAAADAPAEEEDSGRGDEVIDHMHAHAEQGPGDGNDVIAQVKRLRQRFGARHGLGCCGAAVPRQSASTRIARVAIRRPASIDALACRAPLGEAETHN